MVMIGVAALLISLALSVLVAARLLAVAAKTRRAPELALGVALGFGTLGGLLGTIAGYLANTADVTHVATLARLSSSAEAIGASGLMIGMWRIFRPSSRRAAAFCAASTVALGAIALQRAFAEETPLWPIATLPSMVFYLLRATSSAWMAFEAWHYHRGLRARLAIGLADPLVVHQMALWAIAGATSAVVTYLPVLVMIVIRMRPEDTGPVSVFGAGLVLATSLSLWLAFFPPLAYQRLIEQRRNATPVQQP